MKTPDKIYVREFAEGLSQMWSSIRATETSATAQHEYIRKDALLEWAEKCKKIIEGSLRVKYDESLAIRGLMYAVFMDKINEM